MSLITTITKRGGELTPAEILLNEKYLETLAQNAAGPVLPLAVANGDTVLQHSNGNPLLSVDGSGNPALGGFSGAVENGSLAFDGQGQPVLTSQLGETIGFDSSGHVKMTSTSRVLATGAAATVDDVIALLQQLGLCKQA
jgi:hypothetical protein